MTEELERYKQDFDNRFSGWLVVHDDQGKLWYFIEKALEDCRQRAIIDVRYGLAGQCSRHGSALRCPDCLEMLSKEKECPVCKHSMKWHYSDTECLKDDRRCKECEERSLGD